MTTYQYDLAGRRTRTTSPDPKSNTTLYVYNNVDQLVINRQRLTSPTTQDLNRTYSYDELGNLSQYVDRNGRELRYAYDLRQRRTSESWMQGGSAIKTYGNSYDAVGNLTDVSDTGGSPVWNPQFQFSYDRRNDLKTERQTLMVLGSGSSFVFGHRYDSRGNRTMTATNFGGMITPGSNASFGALPSIKGGVMDFMSNYTYDGLNNLVFVTQQGNNGNAVQAKSVEMKYNAANQLIQLSRYSTASSNPPSTNVVANTEYRYDLAGRLSSMATTRGPTPTNTSGWDGNVHRLPTNLHSDNTISAYAFAYDRADRLTRMAAWSGNAFVPPITSIPIANNSFESTQLADGASTPTITGWTRTTGTPFVYNPTTAQYINGAVSDGNNTVALASGASIRQVLTTAYAANTVYQLSIDVGKRLDRPNASEQLTVELYAGTSLLATMATGHVPLADGEFRTHTFAHVSSSSIPVGQLLEVRITAPSTEVNFDNLRLTSTPRLSSYFDSDQPEVVSASYSYRGTDELTQAMETEAYRISNASFEMTPLIEGSYNVGSLIGWSFNGTVGAFNPSSNIYAGVQSTDGNNVAFTQFGGEISQILNDAWKPDRLYTLQVDIGHRPGFTSVNYTIELRSGGTVLASTSQVQQATNPGGWVTSTLDYTTLSSVPYGLIQIVLRAPNNQVNFDNIRLRSTNLASKPAEAYAYDANGNRLSATGSIQSADGTHNRLQSDGRFNYTYDNEGNMTRRTRISDGYLTQYVWDYRNRLTQVVERSSAASATPLKNVQFYYDAFDRRIAKTLDTNPAELPTPRIDFAEYYVYNGANVVFVLQDGDGDSGPAETRLARRILHGNAVDRVLAEEVYENNTGPRIFAMTPSNTPATPIWPIADHVGSVRDVLDASRVVRTRSRYDSYGNRTGTWARHSDGAVLPPLNPARVDSFYAYTGREFDRDIGLQYNRARWYDPQSGRWISQDPIGFAAGDANLYRYVGNHPTYATDPSGNSKVKVIIKVGGEVQKVLRLSYDELRSLLRARVKDAQKPIPDRKYSGEVFVQVKDDKTAKKLAEQASPEGKCVRHEASAEGHPPHYHPVKRYSEPDPNVPGSGGRPDTSGTPHIGSEYTGEFSVALVLPLLEQGGDLIIDASPIGDIRDIVTGVPEIVSGTREILVILSEESEDFYRIQQKSGMLGIQRLSTDGGASNDHCTDKPLRAGSWRNPLPPR